ncbi:isoleucine--tRNA ligase [Candidatus Campbellbacteria bacterium CG22_combo_CG10-13_8_21_14_all_36_13]|uniref:Isoleucine--tRNA ligase n=1 Tax=Candidatus Campbellbacteria bacterium CG22_combo_CG10-13_8_21_14_all_36_13 TaxID=1974529 RepID=A0A2H0DZC0_9BACT|nr:MAG: isoleucine--tRNA ligase [Candidatus Campbellbacteria bacterium CG22_combo_CG10-13_8_21_14_all_36_13]
MESDKSERVLREEEIIKFWKDNQIFQKTLEKKADKGDFVFYEGPPTANGKPGIHHLEARAFKDAIPRYKTMRGFRVRRKAGWDTHGLPVEIEVEKELGIKSKGEIEDYGIDKFNKKCKENVWKYVDLWQHFSERVGYWVDMDDPYVTYYPDYMESLWWIIAEAHKKDLLYKDYKVLPWCPRCGTALSSHELAQGYSTVKDLSLTVKFELVDEPGTFILAWTTTPWTLPGNVALAVGEKIKYKKVKYADEFYILASERIAQVFKDKQYEEIEEIVGKDLVGLEYKPLFPFLKEIISEEQKPNLEKAYKVYSADFVTTEDGTGIVHTAVMYGVDDFNLGTNIGLPKQHLINEKGEFLAGTGFLAGRFVKELETEIEILKDLEKKGLFFAKEKYEHTYPFCWRCKTPLIYFARDSWYIKMTSLQDEMIASNNEINWEPAHIKEGRFGEWLFGIKDWAFSRERYWGTPLPIWESVDGSESVVVDSLETLKKHTKTSGNTYIVMRHGEAVNNVEKIVSDKVDNPHHLTDNGREQVRKSLETLIPKNIDIIITSPFVRTSETAEIAGEVLGISSENIIKDDRLIEIQTGGFNGKSHDEYHQEMQSKQNHFVCGDGACETLLDVKQRVGAFLYELESKYKDKNILIVTHGSPSWMLFASSYGHTNEETQSGDIIKNLTYLDNAEIRELDFVPLPHNENYERDLHRPYVDDVVLYSNKGTELRRVKEVADVWFDSGAMPFAEDHYPFENKEYINDAGFPADYISEAIDQTRGWFYTLHAVGAILGKGKAYSNVICLGHLLDAEGKKMSKSIGNVVDPFVMADKYGVDILRMWMYSINQPGDSKNFDEKTVDEMSKKILNLLENVVKFYLLYREEGLGDREQKMSDNVLDRWITAKVKELQILTTNSLDNYKLLEPARAIREFIGEFSQWYIRRSRDRFKSDDVKEKNEAIETTRFVLLELSKIMAPFMPFISEYIYETACGGEKGERRKESVHLEDWSEFKITDEEKELLINMQSVRDIVSLGLDARDKAGIKVRQPLASLKVKSQKSKVKNDDGLVQLIKDEINVKEVVFEDNEELSVELNTEITKELKREGDLREFLRALQDMRKEKGLVPDDLVETLTIHTDSVGEGFIKEFEAEIKKQVRVENISFEELSQGVDVTAGEMKYKALLS